MHNTFIVEHFHWKRRQSRLLELANRAIAKLGLEVRLHFPEPPIMGNVESRMNAFHFATEALMHGVPGDFVEVGCNVGFTSAVVQTVLREHGRGRAFHVYDSFEGLPPAHLHDQGAYEPGEMSGSRAAFEHTLRSVGLDLPVIHQGWFSDTLPNGGLPDKIAFAIIDADLYESTKTALEHVYPRLSRGAVCMINVYWDEAVYRPPTRSIKYQSPGVKRATDEFFADKAERVSVLYCGEYSSGYFYKQ
jgi:O-methyltransferase